MYLLRLFQEQVDDKISSFWVVEEYEQTPVNQPCSLLQQL